MSKILKLAIANAEKDNAIELHPTKLQKNFVAYICTAEAGRMYAKHVWSKKEDGIDGLTIALRDAWAEIAACIANDIANDIENERQKAKAK